ncbi:MAG: glycosyltransferase family 39 protein [Acidobacteriota bacterium]|nr:glycosyltransferase family 39 protein [Acidobacteriota bacterium]
MKPIATSPSGTENPNAPAHSPRGSVWLPALLLALFAMQSLWFIRTQSLTYDEPAHIIAGVEAWQQGKFEHWNDHPPLGRLWLTLPLAGRGVEFAWEQLPVGFRVTAMRPGPEWLAWQTRPMNTLLGVALGLGLWFVARRLFSQGAATLTLALFGSTPSLIANFSLATTDGIGALFIFLTAFQLVRWRRNPSGAQTAVIGVALGGLLLSKFYAPPLVLLALALMLVLERNEVVLSPLNWNWRPAFAAFVIALAMLWAGYFFHVAHLKVGDGEVVASFPNRAVKAWATKSTARVNALVPAGEFLEGLREVALRNRRGRPAWFLGQVYPRGGIKLYYPVAIALKWPTIVLLLFFASLILGVRKTCRAPSDLLVMSLFGVVYLVFALQSGYDIGERHILPLYPFALLIAGGIWEHARKQRWAVGILVLALCLNAADALRYGPGYLSYFNVFVKPTESWRLLTDSNLDWGQGLLALRDYERQHPNETLQLAYFGSVEPSLYGVRATPLAPGEPVGGTVVAGATCLSGQTLDDPTGYQWLWSYPPRQVLDHALWVFDTDQKLQSRVQRQYH